MANEGNMAQWFSSKDEELQGQRTAWRFLFAFVETFAVKATLQLGIPEIMAGAGASAKLSLAEIAACLPGASADVAVLSRILRFLASRRYFAAESDAGGVTKYGLTPASKWMLSPNCGPPISLAPMFRLINDDASLAPWLRFDDCVTRGSDGGTAFSLVHGANIFEYASTRPAYSHVFNDAMAGTNAVCVPALLAAYSEGFRSVSSLVDVGGGVGASLEKIVHAFPNITTAINYDLPHVIADAPPIQGITHVAGDMFAEVPQADAVFLKWVLHDWPDEQCIKILSNCRRAIPDDKGKVIIVDAVIKENEAAGGAAASEEDVDLALAFDLTMVALTDGGKERTESEWKEVLQAAGFGRYNIILLSPPEWRCVIEAFP